MCHLRLKALPLLIVAALFVAVMPAYAAQTSPGNLALSICRFSVGFGSTAYGVDAQCGVLTVAENPALSDGRKIALHVDVLPALDPNANGFPIFHLEGGPGASAIQGFGRSWYDSYAGLRKTHPIVLIDQRGTGRSGALTCSEINSTAIRDLGKALSPDEEQADALSAVAACYKRLSLNADLRFYTSLELADDTDAVRAALGYDQIGLFGNSYGTTLAQSYIRRHGEHVAGAVLDSVTGPWNYPFLDAPNDGQASLNKVFALCAADTLCNKKYPHLASQLKTALDTLAVNPEILTTTNVLSKKLVTVAVTVERVKSILFELLYSTSGISQIPLLISQMTADNYTIFARTIALLGTDDGIAHGMYMSVVCAENAAFYTDSLIKTHQQLSLFPRTDLGALCKAWSSAALAPADVAPVRSNRPVLILSGALDPITPVRFGTETRARFPNGGLVVFPNQGHGIITGSKCAQTIIEAFFSNPTKAINSACAAKDLKPLFVGAYSVALVPFSSDSASFVGKVPTGWKTEQDDALTFMTSPDGLQFAGEGIYRFQHLDIVKSVLLAQIEKRFGTVTIKQERAVTVLATSEVVLTFTLNRPNQVYYGVIILLTHSDNTYAVWQAAPINWFSASEVVIGPELLASMREPS